LKEKSFFIVFTSAYFGFIFAITHLGRLFITLVILKQYYLVHGNICEIKTMKSGFH
jgi:hypothetical protein